MLVDSRVRVLSVEGGSLKRWDVSQGSAEGGASKTVCVLCG